VSRPRTYPSLQIIEESIRKALEIGVGVLIR
jgi:hypothetical protein